MDRTTTNDDIILVKLGGAILTNKSSTCSIAPESQWVSIFEQVANVYKHHNQNLILIHGVGSFGHPQAKRFAVKDGAAQDASKDMRKGVCLTHAAVLELHSHVIKTLTDMTIPAVSVTPFDHVVTSGGIDATASTNFERMCHRAHILLQQGYVPVLHGDVVMDDKQYCTILSGDVVMRELSRYIPSVKRCVFLTDVDGVFDKDPKTHADAELLTDLPISQQFDHTSSHPSAADVTGSMHGKVKWARQIIEDSPGNKEVIICRQGTKASTLAISGSPITAPERMTVIR
jgi:isopentenyl phosphate kinase